MEDIVNNNIKLIMLDLVGVLVFERDDVLNDKEDKIERLFGPNLSDEEYLNHLEKLKSKSMYDTGIEVTKDDEILILQTCSTNKDYRNYQKKYLLIILRRV